MSATAISMMRQTMDQQAEALTAILADAAPVTAVAERLRGRQVLAIGTGTSWHAASQAAALLRAAGLEASAAQSADAAVDGPLPAAGGVLLALTHTGAKHYTAQAVARARAQGADVVQISGTGVTGADLTTVERERSSAYTASHLGALMRAAQLARALGAASGLPRRRRAVVGADSHGGPSRRGLRHRSNPRQPPRTGRAVVDLPADRGCAAHRARGRRETRHEPRHLRAGRARSRRLETYRIVNEPTSSTPTRPLHLPCHGSESLALSRSVTAGQLRCGGVAFRRRRGPVSLARVVRRSW